MRKKMMIFSILIIQILYSMITFARIDNFNEILAEGSHQRRILQMEVKQNIKQVQPEIQAQTPVQEKVISIETQEYAPPMKDNQALDKTEARQRKKLNRKKLDKISAEIRSYGY